MTGPDKIECEHCGGQGYFETGILCGSARCQCDGWSGGCADSEPCYRCEGTGQLDDECIECSSEVVNGQCVEGCQGESV